MQGWTIEQLEFPGTGHSAYVLQYRLTDYCSSAARRQASKSCYIFDIVEIRVGGRMSEQFPVMVDVSEVESLESTSYPEPYRKEVAGRTKRVLGDVFGLQNFGVVLVDLPPGAWSAQRHWHTEEDEFVYVVSGELTLITDEGDTVLTEGMACGFAAGRANGHHLVNKSSAPASFLVVGDRRSGDEAHYPDVDLQFIVDESGTHVFTRKDGTPFED